MSNTTSSQQNLNVKHVATLFEEVQNRYVNKLISIDEKHITADERHKQKLAVYESYVKDLSIQTRLLLQSLDELEKEANQRVALLESKLKKAHASLQQQNSFSDVTKTVNNIEAEKWKLNHENLDLKHDIDSLISFINTAKRTGKWDGKRLQLKTISSDRIIGLTHDEPVTSIPLHKEIQYRDERIQVLQDEIEHLRKSQTEMAKQATAKITSFSSFMNEDDLKGQNAVLTKKVDDLRSKLAEECQKAETYKMDLRLKMNELKELQQEFVSTKQRSDEHIHDLSTKLKTITDRHREATTLLNNDIKTKKQQIEQFTQQIEQILNEKNQYENERSELQRQCRVKDNINADLETQIRNLQREINATNYPSIPIVPVESTVSKFEYEKLDSELHSVRKRLETTTAELKAKESLNIQYEQELRTLKRFHEEQLEKHVQNSTIGSEQSYAEIRALKRLCDEKDEQIHKQMSELRHCQDHLAIERTKINGHEREEEQLRNQLHQTNEQLEKIQFDLKKSRETNEQLERTVEEFHNQNNLFETKLFETMTLVDLRNKTLIEFEEQMDRMKFELINKHKELLDKQTHIDELEQIVIDKTAEVAQLTETLETGLVKSHHREKYAEDNATKAMNDVKVLQRELRNLSDALVESERTNAVLNEQLNKVTNEYKAKQEEIQQIQKTLNKQLSVKQDQLIRYDQNLHEAEIKAKYAKEECFIQEKEIVRLNTIQEEHENKIKKLQEDLIKLQEDKDFALVQSERADADLKNLKILREEENRKFHHEIEHLNSEITSLKMNEEMLLKNVEELKDILSSTTNERDDFKDQNENYQIELENLQKLLYDETEAASKSSSKVLLLTRQLDDEQRRATEATHQLDDLRVQLKSSLMTNDALKSELIQTRSLLQDSMTKEAEMKQILNRTNALFEERSKSLDDRQNELENLNQILSRLQIDYERSKTDLSVAHDKLVQLEITNQTLQQHLNEKNNELAMVTGRLHQCQQDLHAYEKEHRYSNEEYFEREQRMKSIESELSMRILNNEKLQRELTMLNEDLNKCRDDLEQVEKSDLSHKERLIQSIDEAKIYKRKLALLGDCFKTIVRKASDTSECWANVTSQIHEEITDLSEDVNKIAILDERFEQSTKVLTNLRTQHEDVVLQVLALKPSLEKAHLYLREYKRKCSQINDENRYLKSENKRMKSKIDDFHRAEALMHTKIDEQETNLIQIRKELSTEAQNAAEAQALIERLKRSLDETVYERDQLSKNLNNANKKIEKLDNDVDAYANESRLLQQATQKLEKQLNNAHVQNESMQKNFQQNEYSYQEKINECESLLRSLKDANRETVSLLEQKKTELNLANSEIQSLKYEQSVIVSKMEKVEEMNQELKRHVAALERSNDEQKRLIRKREKEVDQVKNDLELNISNSVALNHKCTKQEAELNVLRLEKSSLAEELKLMRDNVTRAEEEQRRLRKDCDQALNFIHDGIPDLCLDEHLPGHRNASLQEHLKRLPCLMQQLTGDRENLKTKNALLSQFVRGLTTDLNECQSSQKKYKLLKAHSKQQQLLLNQLEAHVRFYESAFKEKGFFPSIEYSSSAAAAAAAASPSPSFDMIDGNNHHSHHHHHRKSPC